MSPAAPSPSAEAGAELEANAVFRALEALVPAEARFAERFYEIFFARRPDTRPLFGVHAIAEREEMIRETFKSILAISAGEPWLEENLVALGRSHAEYGVEADMYPPFVEAFVACALEIAGSGLDAEAEVALRRAVDRITHAMRDAGELRIAEGGC